MKMELQFNYTLEKMLIIQLKKTLLLDYIFTRAIQTNSFYPFNKTIYIF